jgi:uncharacterized protein
MNAKSWNPRRLDVERFASEGAEMAGEWPLSELARLTESASPEAPPDATDVATWQLRGETRTVRGQAQCWLHLAGQARVALVCQRCLQPVEEAIAAERSFLFVHGEEQAAELDADSEDDVLAMTRALDVQALLEDELLLSLPLVPRHEVCPQPLVATADPEFEEGEAEEKRQPFAALAALKRGGPVN